MGTRSILIAHNAEAPMTQAEFVEATNLANLRIAQVALGKVFVADGGRLTHHLEMAKIAVAEMVEAHAELVKPCE